MVIKIIFSDSSTTVLQSSNTSFCKDIKTADNDNAASNMLEQYKDSYEIMDESESFKDEITLDLRKMKQSQTKRMLKAFGAKQKGY